MARHEPARWSASGPWEVRSHHRWYPLGTGVRWCSLAFASRSWRVPSGAAALATARRVLAQPCLAAAWGVERVVEARDRAGRLAWRGISEAEVRDAAREAAGWRGEPPPARDGSPPSTPTPVAPSIVPAGPSPVSPAAAASIGAKPPSHAGGLTEAQRRVVEHRGGPAIVVAVAGAGKTTTMVARVRTLVRAGVPPERVLVTSFSRAAVADVRTKLERAAPPCLAGVEVRTFHSLAHALLREAAAASAAPQRGPGPPPEHVSEQLLQLACQTWRRDGHPLTAELESLDGEAFMAYRGRCLAQLALPDPDARDLPPTARRLVRPAPPDPNAAVHQPLLVTHERLRRERGWRDYDDLVVDAWALLASDAALRERVARRWSHRIVDEFQDVNPAQVALLDALLDDAREVMLIGDDDQSIYGFRGSDPTLLQAVGTHLRATRYTLDHNFRGRAEPLAAAASLVEHLPRRIPKRLRAARGLGGAVTLEAVPGPACEAARTASLLQLAHADGIGWARQAVLLRGFAQTAPIELAFLQNGIPYDLVGAPDLPRHPSCRAALAGLHLVAVAEAPPAVRARAWRQWLTALGMPPARAAARAARLTAEGTGGASALDRQPGRAGAAARDDPVIVATAALARAAADGVVPGLQAAAREILPWPRRGRSAAALSALVAAVEAGAYGTEHVDVATFLSQMAAILRRRARDPERVCITSAHRSKGLEWDVVVVPGQNLGVFPLRDEPEERRLAYVAWTRARERLHLVCDAERPASPFLADARIDELLVVQRDLTWCRAGIGSDSVAAAWAHHDAERRFGREATGTSAPRRYLR